MHAWVVGVGCERRGGSLVSVHVCLWGGGGGGSLVSVHVWVWGVGCERRVGVSSFCACMPVCVCIGRGGGGGGGGTVVKHMCVGDSSVAVVRVWFGSMSVDLRFEVSQLDAWPGGFTVESVSVGAFC